MTMNLDRIGARVAFAALLFLAGVSASAQNSLATADSSARYKAVFHVTEDDPRKWAQVLNNAKYSQSEMGSKNIDIVVVMNGGGINMMRLESPIAEKIDEAKKAGIEFHVCENTMATQKLTRDDMLPQADYVLSGIGDVIKLQSHGWSYVKN